MAALLTPFAADSPCAALREFTPARIALGRTGGSLRTASLLDFRLAHARARDAVNLPLDTARVQNGLRDTGVVSHVLQSAAPDKPAFIKKPALGRSLSAGGRETLRRLAENGTAAPDVAIILSDGHSAAAVHAHAVGVVAHLHALLTEAGWKMAPVLVVPLARVKIQDEIGEILRARLTVMFLGERPGLDSPDSLGCYFTHTPRAACRDADRNCVSNIRAEGIPPESAVRKIFHLLTQSARLGVSGTALKDDTPEALT